MVPESRDIAVFVADQLSGGEKRLLPKEGPERERVIEMLDLHGTLPIEPLTQVPTYKYVLLHVFNYFNYPQISNPEYQNHPSHQSARISNNYEYSRISTSF